MSLVRVHNFAISLDGFGTGEGQSHDAASSRTTSSAGPELHAARSSPARLPLPTGGGTRRLR